MQSITILAAAASLALLTGCGGGGPRVEMDPHPISLAGGAQLIQDGDLYASGAIDEDALAELKDRGVAAVIDLRTADQVPGDYPDVVRALGLDYKRVSMKSNAMSEGVAENALSAMSRARGTGVLLLCASGNRSGAAYGVYVGHQPGCNVEQAIELARRAGLRNAQLAQDLEQYLREEQAKAKP